MGDVGDGRGKALRKTVGDRGEEMKRERIAGQETKSKTTMILLGAIVKKKK